MPPNNTGPPVPPQLDSTVTGHPLPGDTPRIPLAFERYPEEEMRRRANAFYKTLNGRRSVRFFSDRPIPLDVVRRAIHTAGTAPSGAHKQPWQFVLVTDTDLKRKIRIAAEAEERKTYRHRMSEEWRAALRPIGTDWHKPFLETAPALVIVFRRDFDLLPDQTRQKNYYVQESVGIASGMLIAALHNAGLATLTHTPSPMGFLAQLLDRPPNERAYLLLPVGYPTQDCLVPDFQRKALSDILIER
ncbi:MAG: nitroreductase family protein [Nannocystaceae bacterium]